MKNTINILIWRTSESREDGVTNVSDYSLRIECEDFKKLGRFCLENKMSPSLERDGINATSFTVQCDESHHALPTLMERLALLGWRPVPGMLTNETPEYGYFPLRVVSIFDKKDLDSARHLCLETWGSISVRLPILRDEKREICGYDAKGMSGRWSQDFIDVEGLRDFAVSVKGREILESGGLRGLVFREIEWDLPKKVKHPFYIVDCERRMPPCLLPVVMERSPTPTGFYLDGPYMPQILQFSESHLSSVEGVDAA